MKYKILLVPSLLLLIIVSCKKSSSTDGQLPVLPADTLAEGWKKIIINERPELFDIFL